MGYIDALNNTFSITTGDGKEYSTEAGKRGSLKYGLKIMQQSINFDIAYQLAEFNFINVPGKLAIQTVNTGRVFPVEFYFDGSDHRDISEQFRISCNDIRPWTINHPTYGLILAKTASLNFNNGSVSFTKITCTLIETIGNFPERYTLIPFDQVPGLQAIYIEDAILSFDKTPTPSDITAFNNDTKTAYQKATPIVKLQEDIQNLNNDYAEAVNYINASTVEPLLIMRSVTQVLTLPSQFQSAVNDRMRVLVDTFNTLRQTLFGVVTVSAKQIYQNKMGALVSAMCYASCTPLPPSQDSKGDYTNSGQILNVLAQIVSSRNSYYQDLDTLQTDNGGSLLSFIADAQSITALELLINTTIAALYDLALNAKSQRILTIENDTNIIPLTHRIYGLDFADNNLNELIDENDLSVLELIIIPKGREITYYV
jgi:hypothetical protein